MQINVSFNPLDPNDVRALQALLAGNVAVVSPVVAVPAPVAAPTHPSPFAPQAEPLAEPLYTVRREMNDVANELGKKVGVPQKMSTHDRAKLAAQTRWAKNRGQTIPVRDTPASSHSQKKNLEDESKFYGAEEQSFHDFPLVPGEDVAFQRRGTNSIPDGRELIEESYDTDSENHRLDMLSDPDIGNMRSRANAHG